MTEKPPPTESETEKALQYWGYLFKENKSGTDKLNRLLQGIARYIAANFEPTDSPDLTPSQLAAFYRSVGGDYDILLVHNPPDAIAFIFGALRCLYSLQPTTGDEGFTAPSIPALRPKGFITWETIQLLMGPEEHVPILQKALKKYDITDPVDGTLFPKALPIEAFPDKPDQDMLYWYDKVSERLTRDAEASQRAKNGDGRRMDASTTDTDSADDRRDGAQYWAAALDRDRVDRPVARYSRRPPLSAREYVEQRGRDLMQSVRHLVVGPRRRSVRRNSPNQPNEELDDEDEDEDVDDGVGGGGAVVTPGSLRERYVPRHSSRQRSPSPASDSAEESPRHSSRSPRRDRRSPPRSASQRPKSPRRNPVIRYRRSHEPPSIRRDYIAAYSEHPRRHSDQVEGDKAGFGPSKEPPFVQQVAQMHDASVGAGRSYPSPAAVAAAAAPPLLPSSYGTDRPLSYVGSYGGRPTSLYYYSKRGNGDPMPERDRERIKPEYVHVPRMGDRVELNGGRRIRSHSEDRRGSYRAGDEGDDGRGEAFRQKRASHRYVTPVNGVGGRRYPVEQLWR